MENKINVTELLKDCPKGMELNCTTWENVILEKVVGDAIYIKRNSKIPSFDSRVILNQYGCITDHSDEKCRIFPKGKTTWEGFCKPFKDGDVVATATGNWIGITEGGEKDHSIPTYCVIKSDGTFEAYFGKKKSWAFSRLATEEERQKLFIAIKRAGYRWNFQANRLEKLITPNFKKGDKVRVKGGVDYRTINDVCETFYTLIPTGKIDFTDQNNWELISDIKPKFKVGDRVKNKINKWSANRTIKNYNKNIGYFTTINDWIRIEDQDNWELIIEPIFKVGNKIKDTRNNSKGTILKITDEGYECQFEFGNFIVSFKDQDNWKLVPDIKPNFKVGDRIRRKNDKTIIKTIGYIYHDSYALYDGRLLFFKEQDQYELVPDKFEISRLKPFDKVLVRNSDNGKWCGQFYMAYNKNEDYPFECTYNCWRQCIPYKGNEHLRNTTNACRPFYKTWER